MLARFGRPTLQAGRIDQYDASGVRLIVPADCTIRRVFEVTGLAAMLGAVENVLDLD
jgi:hypothetical protein